MGNFILSTPEVSGIPDEAVRLRLRAAWREGDDARTTNHDRATNPYLAGPLRFAWHAGWDQREMPGIGGGYGQHHVEMLPRQERRTVRALLENNHQQPEPCVSAPRHALQAVA